MRKQLAQDAVSTRPGYGYKGRQYLFPNCIALLSCFNIADYLKVHFLNKNILSNHPHFLRMTLLSLPNLTVDSEKHLQGSVSTHKVERSFHFCNSQQKPVTFQQAINSATYILYGSD